MEVPSKAPGGYKESVRAVVFIVKGSGKPECIRTISPHLKHISLIISKSIILQVMRACAIPTFV